MKNTLQNPTLLKTLNDLERLLSGAQRVLIASHVDPDGDTIGSALGLSWALRKRGIITRLTCEDPPPPEVAFLPGVEDFAPLSPTDEDLVIGVDASDWRRMGALCTPETLQGRPLIVIDHHITNQGFGDINIIEEVEATALLVLWVIDHLQIPLDATIATCLLTAIITDTQGFRTSNTTAKAFEAAHRLLQGGANLAQINEWIFYRRTAATLPIWGAALSQARLEDGILWVALPLALVRTHNVNGQATSGLANFMNTVQEAQIIAIFREQEDGLVDISLRSKPGIDVARVAAALGGGGHPQAAGAQVPGALDHVCERVLAMLRASLNQATPQKTGMEEANPFTSST